MKFSWPTLYNFLLYRFSSIVQKDGGTQFKLIVDFKDGGQALYKPMRFPRTQASEICSSLGISTFWGIHSVMMFCKAFCTVPPAIGLILQLLYSPIGNRNFERRENITTEHMPQSVCIDFFGKKSNVKENTELAKQVCPRLRELTPAARGGITQPRTLFLAISIVN